MESIFDITRPLRSGTNPAREMKNFNRYTDNIFDNFFNPLTNNLDLEDLRTPDFCPACDTLETDTHYLMSFDIPGVKKDEIKVEVKDNYLIVSGERFNENENREHDRIRTEKYYGHFERRMILPTGIKAEKVEASYTNGVLKVAIPKSEVSKTQQVKIEEKEPNYWSRLTDLKKDKQSKIS